MALGEEVIVPIYGPGKIVYRGCLSGCTTDYVGVLLDEPHPEGNDGTFGGKRYFFCRKGRGTFAKYDEITFCAKSASLEIPKLERNLELNPRAVTVDDVKSHVLHSEDAHFEIPETNREEPSVPHQRNISFENKGILNQPRSNSQDSMLCKSDTIYGSFIPHEICRSKSLTLEENSDESFARRLQEQFMQEEKKARDATYQDELLARRLAGQESVRRENTYSFISEQMTQDEALAKMLTMEEMSYSKRQLPAWADMSANKRRRSQEVADMHLAYQLQNDYEQLPGGWEPSSSELSSRLNSPDIRVEDLHVAETVLNCLKAKDSMEECKVPLGFCAGFKFYSHQAKGLWWMIHQEKNKEWKGGMLCDQMGLGKTIQAIGLLLSHRSPKGKPTLIVAPLALASQWDQEIQEKAPGQFRVYIYHGSTRKKSLVFLKNRDVIITTYSIVSREYPNRKKYPTRPLGPLYHLEFYRIILDEAHFIKNTRTRSCIGTVALKASLRWCMSGTPIQNKLLDLFAYCQFLRLSPYDDRSRFNELLVSIQRGDNRKLKALLQAVCLRRLKVDVLKNMVGKKIFLIEDDFTKEERDFYNATEMQEQTKFSKFLRAGTVMKNYAHILVMLLRLRQAANHPHLIKQVRDQKEQEEEKKEPEEEKDEDENFVYDPKVMNMLVHEMGFEKNRCEHALYHTKNVYEAAVVWLLENMDNELYDRPLKSGKDVLRGVSPTLLMRLNTVGPRSIMEQECPICMDLIEVLTAVMTPCGHFYCRSCLESIVGVKCPTCRKDFTLESCHKLPEVMRSPSLCFDLAEFEDELKSDKQEIMRPKYPCGSIKDDGQWGDLIPSTKILRLMKILENTRLNDSSTKVIIFSQFVSMLDLVGPFLTRKGFKYLTYDGRMSRKRKDYVIKQFKDIPAGYSVLLMSLRCGSLGLNLTEASKVIFLDLWWNPAVEEQATDRVHRIGQAKEVTVHRLTIKDTVEERILQLQERKREVAQSALNGDINASRLTVSDLKELFGIV